MMTTMPVALVETLLVISNHACIHTFRHMYSVAISQVNVQLPYAAQLKAEKGASIGMAVRS